VLAGAPGQVEKLRGASSSWVLRKLAGTAGPMRRIQDVIDSADTILHRHRQRISRERVDQLAGDWEPIGATSAGPLSTLGALAERSAETVWLAADCRPQLAAICGRCSGIEWKLVRPVSCTTCRIPFRYETDSREQIVREAVRQGCSIEMLWNEGALAEFGGVACTSRRDAALENRGSLTLNYSRFAGNGNVSCPRPD
jgi:hypothetical protein